MAAPIQQGIAVGGYYPSLSLYDYGIKHANLTFVDNYVKYFKPVGIRRYEMMKVMPFMMVSDVLVGLEKLEYFDENTSSKTQSAPDNLKEFNHKVSNSKIIDSIELKIVVPDTTGMTDKQKNRIDTKGLTRWFLKINHKKSAIDESIIQNINEIIIYKNKLPIKHLKCIPELCSYISQKARISGDTQDIREAPVIIEPLHNDMFNMVIPHIPINQAVDVETKVILSLDIPFKGADSNRKFIWSSNLTSDTNLVSSILKNKPDSIYSNPWLDKVHISSMDLGSSIRAKFSVEKVDTNLQQSYQIFTFRRESEDEYFELGMYYCYNMKPVDLIDMLIKQLPNNEYLKEIKKAL